MSEYISREQLKAALKVLDIGIWSDIADIVDGLPVADVAPVVHGHWSKEMRFTEDFMGNRTYGYKCSVCGGLAPRYEFCGHCGAKMDETEV